MNIGCGACFKCGEKSNDLFPLVSDVPRPDKVIQRAAMLKAIYAQEDRQAAEEKAVAVIRGRKSKRMITLQVVTH